MLTLPETFLKIKLFFNEFVRVKGLKRKNIEPHMIVNIYSTVRIAYTHLIVFKYISTINIYIYLL